MATELAVAAVAALVALGAVGYVAFRHVQGPLLAGSGCEIRAHGQVYKLNASQAGIAATIAGVASHEALPNRAVTMAYAAALQESKLQGPALRQPRLGRRVPAAAVRGAGARPAR